MGKNPAFQFYPNDWLGDNKLQMASTVTKGVWIQFLCRMWWSDDRGKIEGTREQLCVLAGCTEDELSRFFLDNETLCFASVTEANKKVTIINRRMEREERARKSNASRQARYKEAHGNGPVTPPSPSPSPSTPSPTPKTTKKRALLANPTGFAAFWSSYPKKLGKGQAEKAWNRVNPQNGLVEVIIASVEAHIITPQWADQQYIPYPATFLNDRRWEDVLLVPTTSPHSTAKTQGNLAALHSFLEQTNDRIRPASVLNADVSTRGDLPGEVI